MADVRVPDVGERGVAVPRPARVHAEDQPRTSALRHAAANRRVHLRHETPRV